MKAVLFTGLLCALHWTVAAQQTTESIRAYVGTYTGGKSEGIYQFQLNRETGAMGDLQVAAKTPNPSFLAIHPNRLTLYAVNETEQWNGETGGGVSAFAIGPDGTLLPLNDQPTGGGAPCHLAIDKTGKYVLVANYSGGSSAVFPIDDGGRLGKASGFVQHEGSSVNPQRQKAPHAHWIDVDPHNRLAFVADLGLDKVLIFRFDAEKGALTPNDPPYASVKPGAGPRHFAFHPNGLYGFVINELDSTLTVFTTNLKRGRVQMQDTVSTLPPDFKGNNSTAELEMHPSGKFLYGSNRGHDSIVVFAVEPGSGHLTYVEHEPTQGRTPRSFGIDPSGRFLIACNQSSGTVVSFRIDPDTGALNPTGHTLEVPSPVCVRFH